MTPPSTATGSVAIDAPMTSDDFLASGDGHPEPGWRRQLRGGKRRSRHCDEHPAEARKKSTFDRYGIRT